jgi:hypothetical protein
MFKKSILLLACLSLPLGAHASMVGAFSNLKELDDKIEEGIFDFDEEYMGEDEEDATADAAAYCQNPNDPEAYVWLAAKKKGKGKKKNCACSSGCGMIQAGLRPNIKKFVQEAAKAGIQPASCIRTQACQDRLRACYERCGQRGRAAKKSKHADGKACDFSKRHGKALSAIKKRTGLPIKRLTHGKEGGGLHEYE